jgi:hypothetical protein
MAKDIGRIAAGLGAEILGQVSNAGGAFGAAKVTHGAAALSALTESESGILGSMREDAELLDAIVEDAMRRRRLQAWCPTSEDQVQRRSSVPDRLASPDPTDTTAREAR